MSVDINWSILTSRIPATAPTSDDTNATKSGKDSDGSSSSATRNGNNDPHDNSRQGALKTRAHASKKLDDRAKSSNDDNDFDEPRNEQEEDDLSESVRAFLDARFQQITLPPFLRSVHVHAFDFGDRPPEIEIRDVCDVLEEFYQEDGDDSEDEEKDDDDGEIRNDGEACREMDDQREDHRKGFQEGRDRTEYRNNGQGTANTGGRHEDPVEIDGANEQRTDIVASINTGTGSVARRPYTNARLSNAFTNALSVPPSPFYEFHFPHSPQLSVAGSRTPGIPGGASNLGYFHLPLSAGLSGTGVAGGVSGVNSAAPSPMLILQQQQQQSNQEQREKLRQDRRRRRNSSLDDVAPSRDDAARNELTSTYGRPQQDDNQHFQHHHHHYPRHDHRRQSRNSNFSRRRRSDARTTTTSTTDTNEPSPHFRVRTPSPSMRKPSPNDVQVIANVHYAGNVRVSLTAEILLNYPMPSFVGIPLKLSITGLIFDGTAVLAYVDQESQENKRERGRGDEKRRDEGARHRSKDSRKVHFCFLSSEDAQSLYPATTTAPDGSSGVSEGDARIVSGSNNDNNNYKTSNTCEDNATVPTSRIHVNTFEAGSSNGTDSLLRALRVESEIGQGENGKQVLKNVDKVERFVLEQIRRVFEEELIFPSYWTFLV